MGTVYPHIVTSSDMLKSIIRLEELISFLQKEKAEAVAIVNSKLYGLLPFWHAMKQANIHAVIGLSVQIECQDGQVRPAVLYGENNTGYQNLLKISSAASIRDEETLPFHWLRGYQEGCILVIPILDNSWQEDTAKTELGELRNIFSNNRLFFGIERRGGEISPLESDAIELSETSQIPIVATHKSTFLSPNDAFSFEIATTIEQGSKWHQQDWDEQKSSTQYVPTSDMWKTWFHDRPEWLEGISELLGRCHITLQMNQVQMPKFPVGIEETAEKMLERSCLEGLKKRVANVTEPYIHRLQYELTVIQKMGYADYFLIVSDFMKYAKENNILTGPGRGSSASSLVAYSLHITDVDPIPYGLLFERFLNPERVSLPDIDIDFADHRRQEVIQYVARKYGQAHTAQIITFGTLSAKAVARDVARAFEFDKTKMETISKLIPNKPGIMLKEAYEQSESFRNWIHEDKLHEKWFQTARSLEGLPRNSSTHAAGVVLSPVPLVNIIPIEKGNDGLYLTQWPMQEVEQVGLLKMDFLGLRNLTILDQIRQMIYFQEKKWIDFERIPLADEQTYRLLQTGDTTGIFQLESDGMRQALRSIRPNHFQDIVAVNALYRPGPMDFIPIYAERKQGKEPMPALHPVLRPILEETYGVIVYQEQIMLIASQMAGFSMGEADLLRRAISKKKKEIIQSEREHFVSNALKRGFPEEEASSVYDLIARFADYGFPKSHAVAYSLISYQMAYLKTHFPVYFYAALLTSAIGNQEKLAKLLQEVKQKGIPLFPPSINKSGRGFRVENGGIRMSLSIIKGVPSTFTNQLLQSRKERKTDWEDLFDFAVDLTTTHFTRKTIEGVIKAGALDDLQKDRNVLLASIEAAVKHAEILGPKDEYDLFEGAHFFGKPKYVDVQPLPERTKLQYEKEVLGFYLSTHPITKEKELRKERYHSTQELFAMPNGKYVKLLGIIDSMKQIRTRKGEQMAFAMLEDEHGQLSVTLFPKEFEKYQTWLSEGEVVSVEGVIERRQGKIQLVLKKMDK